MHRFAFTIAAALAAPQLPVTAPLPVTIELRRDVEVRDSERLPDGSAHQLRGVLYASQAMRLRRGERLTMVAVGAEGGCRVRVRRRELDLASCPWLEGFADHQSDTFVIVARKQSRRAPADDPRRPR